MGNLILPRGLGRTAKPAGGPARQRVMEFFRDIKLEPALVGYCIRGIERAIAKSLILEPPLSINQAAVIRERFNICYDLLKIMAYDEHWGIRRSADQLEVYLIKKIRKEHIEFPKRSAWLGPGKQGG